MAQVHRPIEQLQLRGNRTWLLDSFGGLLENPQDSANPSIECILTPCEVSPDRPNGLKRNIGNQVCGTIGVCAIGAVSLGQQFVGGRFVPLVLETGSPEETITFRLDTNVPESIEERMLSEVGIHDHSALINNHLQRIHTDSAVKLIQGALTATNNPRSPDRLASTRNPLPLRVLIYELELIRFYYTNSERLVRAVFNGEFQEDFLYRKVICALHEGPHYDAVQKKHRLEYRHGFDRYDMYFVARALFESSLTALDGIRRVHRSARLAKLNARSERDAVHPRTHFPYQGKSVLTLSGRRCKLIDGSFIFVAHRIESCNALFPFELLSIQCELEPGGFQEAKPGSPVAFNGPPRIRGPGNASGSMDSESRPQANSSSAPSTPDIRRFIALESTQLVAEKYRPNTHLSGKPPKNIFDPGLDKTSPGKPTSGKSNAVKQRILDTPEGGEAPVDLNAFITILTNIRAKYSHWAVTTVPAGPASWTDDGSGVIYSTFPTLACPARYSVTRQFSFVDKFKQKRRRLICAEIRVRSKHIYLLEAERRVNDLGSYMEMFPILVLWTPGFTPIARPKFEEVLLMTIENPSKTWPKNLSEQGLLRRGIEHGKAKNITESERSQNITDLSGRILKILCDIFDAP